VQVAHTRVASAPVTATMRRMPLAIASSVTMTTEPMPLVRFKCLQHNDTTSAERCSSNTPYKQNSNYHETEDTPCYLLCLKNNQLCLCP